MTMVNQDIGTFDEPHVRGDDRQVTFYIVDEAGAPKNLTGVTEKEWQAWDSSGVVVAKIDADISIINGDATNDALRFTITAGDQATLAAGVYRHELCGQDATGNRITFAKGRWFVVEDLINT